MRKSPPVMSTVMWCVGVAVCDSVSHYDNFV